MKNSRLLFVAASVLAGVSVAALDPPHNGSFTNTVATCADCHLLHSGAGTLLGNSYTSNNHACLQCHDTYPKTANTFFSSAWSTGREAIPGTSGDQHNWSGSALGAGARLPTDPAMAQYLSGGSATLQCAVCHDAHGAKNSDGLPVQDLFAPNSYHVSRKLNVAYNPDSGSGGTLTILRIDDGGIRPIPDGYAVRVKTGGASGTLEIAHDIGSGAPTYTGSIPYSSGAEVNLDDPSVVIKITGAPVGGTIWTFYISYPLLRATNEADAMCTDCHADRKQNHACVEGSAAETDGAGVSCSPNGTTRYYSHPVNQTLNANVKGYDAATPLDADGSADDSLVSNNLVLDAGNVRCTTCHAPHNADSNSLTEEVR